MRLNVKGLTSDIKRVRVSAALDGKPAKPIDDFVGDTTVLATLGFDLPADSRGMLNINIQAIPDYPFVIAAGQVAVAIESGGLTESTVDLKRVEICTADRWCWERPLPSGRPIRDIWGAAPNDIWAVSQLGAMFHYDGQVWTYLDLSALTIGDLGPGSSEPRTAGDLLGIFGTSASDIWAVGENSTVLHYDGKSWQRVASPTTLKVRFSSVWARGPNDVWVMGSQQQDLPYIYFGNFYVFHSSDGVGWTPYDQAALGLGYSGLTTKIWGAGDAVYALGWYYGSTTYKGAALTRYQNGGWTNISSVLTSVTMDSSCEDMTGSSASDLWVLCNGMVLRGDGTTMRAQAAPKGKWARIWVQDPSAAWLVGDPDDSVSKGFDNAIARFSSGSWSIVPTGGVPSNVQFTALWGDSSGSIWVGGLYGLIRQLQQGTWTHHLPRDLSEISRAVTGVAGSGPTDVWATTDGAILHSDGTTWTATTSTAMTPLPLTNLSSAWALGPSDAWVVSLEGKALHYDGRAWTPTETGLSGTQLGLQSVWGADGSNVWAAGSELGIRIIRWDGARWSREATPATTDRFVLRRIFGTDKTHVFAVGGSDDGANSKVSFLAYDGATWADQSAALYANGAISSGQRALDYIWASSPTNIWLSGYQLGGSIFFNGASWQRVPWFESGPIWGLSDNNLIQIGRYDLTTSVSRSGTGKTAVRLAGLAGYLSTFAIAAVWGSGAELWAVGEGGTILHRKSP